MYKENIIHFPAIFKALRICIHFSLHSISRRLNIAAFYIYLHSLHILGVFMWMHMCKFI